MKNRKRALRRHHRNRIKNNLKRNNNTARGWLGLDRVCGQPEEYERWIHNHYVDTKWMNRALSLMEQSRPLCSCCSNPRNLGWGEDRTRQEKRQYDNYLDQIRDLDLS